MEYFLCALALTAIPLIFIVGVTIMLPPLNSCQESSEAVVYARSLPQERLKRLYEDMEGFSKRDDLPFDGYSIHNKNSVIPEEFSDLKVIKIRPESANIMVQGCFDHYIYLRFTGYGSQSKFDPEKKIILNWGEHPPNAGTQVL